MTFHCFLVVIKNQSYNEIFGKNQKYILVNLKEQGPLFFSSIKKIPELNNLHRKNLLFSLKSLYRRGFISRTKKINEECNSFNKLNYEYKITERGMYLLESFYQ